MSLDKKNRSLLRGTLSCRGRANRPARGAPHAVPCAQRSGPPCAPNASYEAATPAPATASRYGLEIDNVIGKFAQIAMAIGVAGGSLRCR